MKAGKVWGETCSIFKNGVFEFHHIKFNKGSKTNNKENIWKPKNLGKQKFNRANSKSKNKVAVFKVSGTLTVS